MREVATLVEWLGMLQQLGGRELMMVGALLEDVPAKLAELMGVDPELVRPETGPKGRDKAQENLARVMGAQMQGAPAGAPAPPPLPQAA